MNIEVLPPDVNSSRVRLHGGRRQDPLRPERHQGLRQRRGRGDRRRARARTGRSRASSISASGSIRRPATARRSKRSIKAGAFDSLGGHRAQLHGRARPGVASGRRRCWPTPLRPEGPVRRRRRRRRPSRRRRRRCPTCPSWTRRNSSRRRRKCSASTSPATRWPSTSRRCARSARTRAKSLGELDAPRRSAAGRHARRDQVLAHQEPAPGQHHTKYAMCDLEDLDGIIRCILWPEQFAEYGQLVKADAILALRGNDRPPARQRGSEPHRRRADPARPTCRRASPAAS